MLLASVATGCAAALAISTQAGAQDSATVAPTTPTVVSTPIHGTPSLHQTPTMTPAVLAQQMQAAIQGISPGTEVGIEVADLDTGAVLAGLNADRQFYTASVVKLLIALDALKSQGWQPVPDSAAEISAMLSTSDDNIADALWDANGGDSIVDRMIETVGLTGTEPPADPAEWGETLTTAQDVVAVYRYLTTTVPEPSRTIVLTALRDISQISADGTDQYFGIPDGLSDNSWAVKQGWMALNTSTTLDTTGLVGPSSAAVLPYAVVVLTSQGPGTSWATGGSALTAGITQLRSIIR
ncbi:serine hydrolase [Nocardia sp. NPDC049149]|uniref:serine hydrolase n=1 Tax=Nocardia sp. NPDC049149 TaxID=3364315 RepID=UPI00371B55BA